MPDGARQDLREFARLDATGTVVERYQPHTWSIEEELGAKVYAVLDGELRELSIRIFMGPEYRVERKEKPLLRGLRIVSPWDLNTQQLVQDTFRDDRRRVEMRALRLKEEGEARVASIPAPEHAPSLGVEYSRALNVLRKRVHAYGDDLDIQLLKVLAQFGRLAATCCPSGRLKAAAATFIGACELIATLFVFTDAGQETPDKFSLLSREAQTELRQLIDALVALRQKLLVEAEHQAYIDANSTAAAYRGAAVRIARAKELLEGGLSS